LKNIAWEPPEVIALRWIAPSLPSNNVTLSETRFDPNALYRSNTRTEQREEPSEKSLLSSREADTKGVERFTSVLFAVCRLEIFSFIELINQFQ